MAVLLGMDAALPNRAHAFEKPSHETLPNFDKRREAGPEEKPMPADKAAAALQLKTLVPGVRIESGDLPWTPRHIASPGRFLSGPKGQSISAKAAQPFAPGEPHQALKSFLREYKPLLGHGPEALDHAWLKRQFVTPHNGLQTFVWEQHLDEIPIFDAVLLAHVAPEGELVSVSSQFVVDPEKAAGAGQADRMAAAVSPKISVREALVRAAKIVGEDLRAEALKPVEETALGKAKRQRFKGAPLIGEPEASLVWLPIKAGELRLCWQAEVKRRKGGETFRVLIDAETGEAVRRIGKVLRELILQIGIQQPQALRP